MADPVVTMFYNESALIPAPTFSYSTVLVYNNDLVTGYNYTITLNGYCIPKGDSDEPNTVSNVFNKIRTIENIFSSNGGALSIKSDNKPLIYATDVKVISVSFNEASNNWSRFAPYTVQLECNHLFLGTDLTSKEADIISGKDDPNFSDSLHSPNIVNMENHKIKSFNENFNINVDDNIFSQLAIYVENNPNINTPPKTFISNNYYNISLTVSATGRHDVVVAGGQKTTLPAWEHAKRFVHNRLMTQLSRIANNFEFFMRHGNNVNLEQLHNPNLQNQKLIDQSLSPSFSLYNETINFSVSESEGSFEATYNAIVKQNCLIQNQPGVSMGCTNAALHTINKAVNKTYNANEETDTTNQEISISINGEIKGLIPGYNIGADSRAPFKIASLPSVGGSFATTTPNGVGVNVRMDRTMNAEACFNNIFNFVDFDFNQAYKDTLGINATNLQINPATKILPSKMNLTRNYIEGTINYSAEYNNTFNCPTNHFSVDISVEEPIPIIAEFIIPNNNNHTYGTGGGTPEPSGFPIIQNLGTETAKKINVTINGNLGDDFDKCCLGTDDSNTWNMLDYEIFNNKGPCILPSGLILPVISPNYVLTSKTKKTTYPQGNFTISLSYTCATTCALKYISEYETCD